MAIASLPYMKMYYESHGEGEPLFLVSGFSADHTTWSLVVDALAKKFRVILLDNCGVGQSSCRENVFTIDEMAQDIQALCGFLEIKNAHFVGSSMGGFIVQSLARIAPSLVNKMVIVNSGYQLDIPFVWYLESLLMLRKHLNDNIPTEILLKNRLGWVYSHQFLNQPGMYERFLDLATNAPVYFPIKAFECQLHAVKQFNSTSWISTVKHPTLVTGSNGDLIFNEQHTRHFASLLPNASYAFFKNIGHLPQIEAPKAFIEEMFQFF